MTTNRPTDLPRTVGFLAAAGIMIGVAIGSGIYRTPASIAAYLDAPWQILAVWVAGGLLSLVGALTYAELAAAFPRSGGLYNFLYQGLGPRVAFVFGWTYMLITKPLAASGIAMVFGEYFLRVVGEGWHARLMGAVLAPEWLAQALSARVLVVCLSLSLLTYINYRGMRQASWLNFGITLIKVASLLFIVGLAMALGGGEAEAAAPVAREMPGGAGLLAGVLIIAPVMASVLWTYDGWADVGSIAGEVREPQRNLPRIFIAGTLGLTGLYLLVNWAFLRVLTPAEMAQSPAVAAEVMSRLVGPWGVTAVTVMVLISTLGATHASITTGARVTFAQAQDGLLFSVLGRVHPRHQTPHVSLWVQLTMSCVCAVFFGTFDDLAGGFVFTMWIFYGLGAIALLRLRRTRPDLARPYRCWGYPVVPLIFIACAAGMTALQIVDAVRTPAGSEPGAWPGWAKMTLFLGILGAGWPAHTLWERVMRRHEGA